VSVSCNSRVDCLICIECCENDECLFLVKNVEYYMVKALISDIFLRIAYNQQGFSSVVTAMKHSQCEQHSIILVIER
jgi:hypothetical protein